MCFLDYDIMAKNSEATSNKQLLLVPRLLLVIFPQYKNRTVLPLTQAQQMKCQKCFYIYIYFYSNEVNQVYYIMILCHVAATCRVRNSSYFILMFF